MNAELVRWYWDIGRIIHDRQHREGWGVAVIPRLAAELKNELPDLKGFSERNIDWMIAFYRRSVKEQVQPFSCPWASCLTHREKPHSPHAARPARSQAV